MNPFPLGHCLVCLFLLWLSTLTGMAQGQPGCVPRPAGLVATWRGEGNAQDSIGPNHGALRDGTTFVPGKVGQAFHFDGNGDFVEVPISEMLQPREGMTIEGWVYVDQALPSFAGIAGSWHDITGNGRTSLLWTSGSQLQFYIFSGGATDYWYATATTTLPSREWTHVAGTYDGAMIRVYQNGALVGSSPFQGAIATKGYPFLIGRVDGAGKSQYWPGAIDELSFYNRALSDEEIRAIHAADASGKCDAIPLALRPESSEVPAGDSVTFVVEGGQPPYVFSVANVPAFGTLDPVTGVYVAGSADGVDTIRVVDASGAVATATVKVSAPPIGKCAEPLTGLVAWWRGQNNALDTLDQNSGILRNGTGFGAGKVGNAFHFDGIDDVVEVADSPAFEFNRGMTLEGWIRVAASSGTCAIALKGTPPFAEMDWAFIALEDGGLSLSVVDATGAFFQMQRTAPGVFTFDTWTHVAASFDPTANEVRFYVNGVEAKVSSSLGYGAVSRISRRPMPLMLGINMNGGMDEFAVFSRVLSPAEIRAVVEAGAAGKCDPAPRLEIFPQVAEIKPGGGVTFSASGGVPPYAYRLLDSSADSSIDWQTGQFTSGAGCGVEMRVQVADQYLNTREAVVRVLDRAEPVIHCPSRVEEHTTSVLGKIVRFSVAASDDCDPSPAVLCTPSSGSVFPPGVTTVVCTATDASGHRVNCSFEVNVIVDSGSSSNLCDPPLQGLVGWWRGESNALDSVGGQVALLREGAAFGTGKVGTGFALDGVDDFVRVADRSTLELTGDITVQLWARPTKLGTFQTMLSKGGTWDAIDGPSSVLVAILDDGRFYGGFERQDGSNVELATELPVTGVLGFHHYAYVRSGNRHMLFVDGEIVAQDGFEGAPGSALGRDLFIGAFNSPHGAANGIDARDFFDGQIDEVAIHDRALSVEELRRSIHCEALPMIEVAAIELVQSIQDLKNNVPLVADKRTFARVHLRDPQGGGSGSALFTGKLRGYRNGIELADSPLVPLFPGFASTEGDLLGRRSEFQGGTLNFELPPHWCTAGSLLCRIEPDPATPAMGCGSRGCETIVEFTPSATLALKIFRVRAPDAPSMKELDRELTRVKAMFPVSDLDVRFGEIDRRGDYFEIATQLGALQRFDQAGSRIYFGALTEPESGVTGMAMWAGLGQTTRAACGLPYAMAHELGHCLGIDHPSQGDPSDPTLGICGETVDPESKRFPYIATIGGALTAVLGPMDAEHPEDMMYGVSPDLDSSVAADGVRAIDPFHEFEVMSYCNKVYRVGWTSADTYRRLLASIVKINASVPRNGVAGLQDFPLPSVRGSLFVSGSIQSSTGHASLNPLIPVLQPTPSTAVSSEYSVQLLGAAGQLLSESRFDPVQAIIESPGTSEQQLSFGLLVPLLTEAQSIVVRSNTTTLAFMERSAHPPLLKLVSPSRGDVFAEETVTVRWEASDPDSDPLTFAVQYSPDEGRSFTTLTAWETNQVLTLSRSALVGSPSAVLRVIATDGFNFAIADSQPFEVTNNRPAVFLHLPTTNHHASATSLIRFEAAVYDAEDGQEIRSLVWSSSQDGVLGNGPVLSRSAQDLSEGTHIITVTAMDTSGATDSAATVLTVSRFRAPLLKAMGIDSLGQLKLGVLADEKSHYVLERSTDLRHWEAFRTNSMRSQVELELVPNLPPATQLFYRAIVRP